MTLPQRPQLVRSPGAGLAHLRGGASSGSRPGTGRVPRLECLEDRLAPATLAVTSAADSGAGTLRHAIQNSVNHTGGGTGNDTIQFAPAIDGSDHQPDHVRQRWRRWPALRPF